MTDNPAPVEPTLYVALFRGDLMYLIDREKHEWTPENPYRLRRAEEALQAAPAADAVVVDRETIIERVRARGFNGHTAAEIAGALLNKDTE